MFVDHIKIKVKAGDGGNGCSSFRREKYVPKGGPDGGDGGKGGDVILQVDHHTDNLKEFFYRSHQKAERGKHGKGQRRTGKSGKNLVLKVPAGTIVRRLPDPDAPPAHLLEDDYEVIDLDEVGEEGAMIEMSRDEETWLEGEEEEETEPEAADEKTSVASQEELGEVVADMTEEGQQFLLCRGGVGGKGNWNYRTDTNQAPVEFTLGDPGEEGEFYLELRKIADVGLVGFPNAGKSTLLRALSNATPKVAAYPFTTLQPMIGVVEFSGYHRATVADIPGLIEGAHRNIGLGHDFLRHISRCSLFLFVVDAAAVDQRDPISDIQTLRTELKLYDEELSKRPWLIVANKIDLEEATLFLSALETRFPNVEVVAISAAEGDGMENLRTKLKELVATRPT